MSTLNQLHKFPRIKRKKKNKTPLLENCPQKKGMCLKVYTTSPKKPNSAQRKVAKVRLSTKSTTIAYIPGEGHSLQQYSIVLMRGGRVKDLPGVRYKLIRNKFDLSGLIARKKKRSKYGTRLWSKIGLGV